MDLFEIALSAPDEDVEFSLEALPHVEWMDFLLNPRRLRGSDFLMRWSQGVWSERRLQEAVNATGTYFALPYGPSSTAPDDDPRAFELYFERLELAGLGQLKRPDLLIFRDEDRLAILEIIKSLKGIEELPFISEDNPQVQALLSKTILAVECENSLWKARKMPDFGKPLTPQRRLGGHDGMKRGAVLPTIIIKEEDRDPLRRWQSQRGVRIHIWHVFYDMGYGIAFDRAEQLIKSGDIEATKQRFQAPGGAVTEKPLYKLYYHYGYLLGATQEEPKLASASIEDKNGHILPYVRFEGGSLTLGKEALRVLDEASRNARKS